MHTFCKSLLAGDLCFTWRLPDLAEELVPISGTGKVSQTVLAGREHHLQHSEPSPRRIQVPATLLHLIKKKTALTFARACLGMFSSDKPPEPATEAM